MLYQSLIIIKQLNPPPQQFKDLVYTISRESCLACKNELDTFYEIFQEGDFQDDYKWTSVVSCTHNNFPDVIKSGTLPEDVKGKNFTKNAIMNIKTECENHPLNTFTQTKELNFDVPINSKLFEDLERVRVDGVKVCLNGASSTSGYISGTIQSFGLMHDRFKQNCFSFETEHFVRSFRYKYSISANSDQCHNEPEQMYSPDVHEDYANYYQSPSIFTNWRVNLKTEEDDVINLQQLRSIQISFTGSFIGVDITTTTTGYCKRL